MNNFEVILLGTGGGYGESVVVQLCNHNWIIIDSCINPYTNESLPLNYLNERGVDISKDVKLVICSHWHDDHIKGLDSLLDACKSSIFTCPMTSDKDKFLRFVELDSRKEKGYASSTSIFSNCLDIIKKRNGIAKLANQDKLLFKINSDNIIAEVYSLSPTDSILAEFGKEISQLLKDQACCSNTKIKDLTPNNKCVVIFISINGYSVILGGDLENTKNYGWKYILDNSISLNGKKISLIKIPHHGSKTSYEKQLWDNNVNDYTIGQISPFVNASTFLPTREMLETYLSNTTELYVTTKNYPVRSIRREKAIEKAIKKLNPSIKENAFKYGIIRSFIDIDSKDSRWRTEVKGCASKVDSTFLNNM